MNFGQKDLTAKKSAIKRTISESFSCHHDFKELCLDMVLHLKRICLSDSQLPHYAFILKKTTTKLSP